MKHDGSVGGGGGVRIFGVFGGGGGGDDGGGGDGSGGGGDGSGFNIESLKLLLNNPIQVSNLSVRTMVVLD
jgi:hypothetical protein